MIYSADGTGDPSPGIQAPLEAGKVMKTDFLKEPPEEPSLADTNFSPGRPIGFLTLGAVRHWVLSH